MPPVLDFSPWNQMLEDYVNDQGEVDYARWRDKAAGDLDRWLDTLKRLDLSAHTTDSALAFLLNLYNALTVQQVLKKYPISSIRPRILGIPNWLVFLRFFTRPVYRLRGQALSLNAIEHNILRQRFREPRIHFALVCASVGCPLLRPEAYAPTRVSMQLEDDGDRFVNNPDKVRYDANRHILWCSKIFKWYGSDFLTAAESIPGYIRRYWRGPEFPDTAEIRYLPYDWSLNQRTSSN